MNLPIGTLPVEDSLKFDETGWKKEVVIGWGASERILEVERVGAPENNILA
jgi:hypothetical protein